MSILVIEANSHDRQALESTLRTGGYSEIHLADSVEAGLSMLGVGADASCSVFGAELIIIGGSSPEDTAEACRKIRMSFRWQDTPIIMLGILGAAEGLPLAVANGASDYLRRPFSEVEFVTRVRLSMRLKYEIDRRKAREHELLEATRQLADLNGILTKMALVDNLTGVANRRHFDKVMESEWRRCFRSKSDLSLVMLDIDHFKAYNDNLGHLAGDVCLRQVANELKMALRRPGDTLSRYGGEEFAVVLPDTPLAGAQIVAENLRLAIENAKIPHPTSLHGGVVTVSVGVACTVPGNNGAWKALLKLADEALYEAKKLGRNRVAAQHLPPDGTRTA